MFLALAPDVFLLFIASKEAFRLEYVASNSKFEETLLLSRKCIPDKFDGRGLGKWCFFVFFKFHFLNFYQKQKDGGTRGSLVMPSQILGNEVNRYFRLFLLKIAY